MDKIFLIGFMGSGKTYWGQKWAHKYGVDFFDIDELIEATQHKSIVKLFEQYGEHYFREIETAVLQNLSTKTNCIVACGGGTACFNDNMQWMNENGLTVYLKATAQYLQSRVINEADKRPLIKNFSSNELLFFIEKKLKEREPFYNQSKIILPVNVITDEYIPGFINLQPK